jgi:Fe-Mn family superoxide dismutase
MTLEVLTLRNNESVLFVGKPALFAIDLWEHAYYLQYRDRKADYVRNWWEVVNWPYIGERLQGICEGRKQL